MSLRATLLFHLNLNYSAIEVGQRRAVVRRCYRPLLELCDRLEGLVLAVEASAHTLERVARLDPEWIDALRALVSAGRVELVGSGDSQLIGPLVPASVNAWNQRLGRETYARLVGVEPTTALVNELAWSQGLVDAYADAGYDTLLAEWNNPRRLNPDWDDELRYRSAWTRSPRGTRAAVAWVDAVAFQKFQRAVHGELDPDEYVAWVLRQRADRPRHLFLYANDAEVFDYRPGRFHSEPPLLTRESEWERMESILRDLLQRGVRFTTPARLRDDPDLGPAEELLLSNASDPIPVKKQPKYNATRWALSGWDDVGINARCFDRARELEADEEARPEDWRLLCRAWASDLRTHLTPRRWQAFRRALPASRGERRADDPERTPLEVARVLREERRLVIETDGVELALLPRRGLAIEWLRLRAAGDGALAGTLFHGAFDDIDWAADFYSGHTVVEIPAHRRVTDLESAEPEVQLLPDRIEVTARVETPLGPLPKTVRVFADRVELEYGLSAWGERPTGSLRTGIVTLLPSAWDEELAATCANGGAPERFPLSVDCDHGASVSPLVSARAVLGATDGTLTLDDGRRALELSWPEWRAAALPLLTVRRVGAKRFVRVAFSLSEIDETHRPGAPLHDFCLTLSARRLSA